MEWLFSQLSQAVEGSAALALAAAGLWGVLSILLSPCHLASIPLIVAYIDRQGPLSTGRACGIAALFAGGILLSIAAIGVLTALAGRMLGDVGPWGNYLVAAIFLLVGLHLLEVVSLPGGTALPLRPGGKGAWAALLLGLIFGIALGPCTFAFMAPMLGLSFRLGSERELYAALLLVCYGAGHCGVIVAAGASTQLVQKYLNWTQRSGSALLLRRGCGLLLLAGGLYLIYTAR